MDESDYRRLEGNLRRNGWTQSADGAWNAPGRGAAVGSVEAGRSERPAPRPLDGGGAEREAGEGSVGARVVMVAFRRRCVDPDAVAFSMKPLTDAVAATLGVDDADPRVEWEWRQVRTDGEEGVAVRVEVERMTERKSKRKKVENSCCTETVAGVFCRRESDIKYESDHNR